jgi:predicted nucleotidyltransferase
MQNASIEKATRETLMAHGGIRLAILFGSMAAGKGRADSDVDLAIDAGHVLDVEIKRHVFDEADFMPYYRRILGERRDAWIAK